MISEFDAQMGRLVDYLKSIGAYDSTLIVITSDHDEQMAITGFSPKTAISTRPFTCR